MDETDSQPSPPSDKRQIYRFLFLGGWIFLLIVAIDMLNVPAIILIIAIAVLLALALLRMVLARED